MKTFELYAKLHDSQRRFNRACDQILLLNTRLRGLRKRYKSARSSDSFLRYVSWYKYLIVSLVFSHLGFWSGNLFLIAPFPDLCLLVPFSKTFRFPLRIRMMAVEGLIKTYYHYADVKRNEILECRAELSKLDIDENEEVFSDDEM